MSYKLYPFTFESIFKERIWGGTKLRDLLHKNTSSDLTGESWELSAVPTDVSVVSKGIFKGKNLNELIEQFPGELLGTSVFNRFGKQFPLLFKYLDAREDLSIQVHPNDELAEKRHHSLGKTEMWYVMQADKDARIIVGFKADSSKDEYLQHIQDKKLLTILKEVPVKKGDVFFLETGTIHAIGAGILLAEIQQTSDVTYRIYDFDRVDAQGNARELHIDLSLDAVNYQSNSSQIHFTSIENTSTPVVDCLFFKTSVLPLKGVLSIEKTTDSFVVFMCTEGSFELHIDSDIYRYQAGDTVLVPAILTTFSISGTATILEVTV
jgi:mannose-6-phosphate isomerase